MEPDLLIQYLLYTAATKAPELPTPYPCGILESNNIPFEMSILKVSKSKSHGNLFSAFKPDK